VEKDCGIEWVDANTHNVNITNNNKQDGLDFTPLNFLPNIYEKKRQLIVVLLSDKEVWLWQCQSPSHCNSGNSNSELCQAASVFCSTHTSKAIITF